MSSVLKIYGEPFSVSTLPVLMTAAEGGIPYELIEVPLEQGGQLTPEYRKMNPMHCVPTIDDGGFVMWEARAISKYLCGQYNLPDHFYPKDVKKRAVCDMALDLHQGVFYPNITFKVLYPACGFAHKPKEEEIERSKKALDEDIWPALQKFIAMGDGPLLGGENPNVADFFFALHIYMIAGRCPDSFVASHAGLTGYLAAVKAKCPRWGEYITAGAEEFFSPSGHVCPFVPHERTGVLLPPPSSLSCVSSRSASHHTSQPLCKHSSAWEEAEAEEEEDGEEDEEEDEEDE
eukprot:CAMPEP_0181297572 /NCGR_PEP_ID=MMETSP1101-20121128/5311_1 /TAXON_ID=46948 /ORGANISM="Rhodomonas abbreviata, Strain Caron Lab Isolate" /LENGTH=289 /DNA_ID=CAMNT_0023402517 /DNA_START=14 /DNA_END=881 /DNA_ORIENTATION=+